jgi:hypothetical protein
VLLAYVLVAPPGMRVGDCSSRHSSMPERHHRSIPAINRPMPKNRNKLAHFNHQRRAFFKFYNDTHRVRGQLPQHSGLVGVMIVRLPDGCLPRPAVLRRRSATMTDRISRLLLRPRLFFSPVQSFSHSESRFFGGLRLLGRVTLPIDEFTQPLECFPSPGLFAALVPSQG